MCSSWIQEEGPLVVKEEVDALDLKGVCEMNKEKEKD